MQRQSIFNLNHFTMKITSLLIPLPLCLVIFSCFDLSSHIYDPYESVFYAHEVVLEKENTLQSEIERVMALQTSSPDSISDSLYAVLLDQQVVSLWAAHREMLEAIGGAKDSLDSLKVRLKREDGLPHRESILQASHDFLSVFNRVGKDEYIHLITLITLPDTAYTQKKHKEYIRTGELLNTELDRAVNVFNDKMESYGYKERRD